MGANTKVFIPCSHHIRLVIYFFISSHMCHRQNLQHIDSNHPCFCTNGVSLDSKKLQKNKNSLLPSALMNIIKKKLKSHNITDQKIRNRDW